MPTMAANPMTPWYHGTIMDPEGSHGWGGGPGDGGAAGLEAGASITNIRNEIRNGISH